MGSDATSAGRRVDFFVSHAGRDQVWAEWLAWQLIEAGYTVELDAWDWTPGQDFVARMQQALHRADRLLAVWSEAYFRSPFGGAELRAAFVQQPKATGRIVPVLVEPAVVPDLYASLIYVDLVGLDEAAATTRLRARLAGGRPAAPPRFPASSALSVRSGVASTGRPVFAGRLPAAWNVPARNPHFVGRAELLTELRRRLRAGEHTLVVQALHGLGGVGKTQLAIEYVHRFAADYKLVWWIDAEQPALLAGQLAALAGPLGLPTGRPVGEAVPMVLAELRHRPRWLLVFDNAQRPQDLLDYWPDGGGQVVVTSRYPGWGGLGGRLEVDVLARAETVELLRRRLPEVDEELADLTAASSLALPLFWLGEAEGARALAQDTVDRARRVLGPNHRTTVYAEAVLTLALVQLGQPHLARTLGHNMVERGRRVLGADHMVTLDVAATLTLALVQLGEPGPARALGEDTVQRCRRVLGPDHQVTLLTAAALTLALIELGEPEPACALGEDTMERSLRMCGPDYIVRLLSATSLALALARLGKPEAARTLGKDTLDRCRRVYGSHHPFTRFVAHVVGPGSPGRSPLISLGTSQGTQ